MSYLRIDEKVLEKNKEAAKKLSIEECGDDGKDDLRFDPEVNVDEVYFDDKANCIRFSYTLNVNGQEFGCFADDVTLEMDTVIEIIEYYRKKLGKLKTVFEATKDEEAS